MHEDTSGNGNPPDEKVSLDDLVKDKFLSLATEPLGSSIQNNKPEQVNLATAVGPNKTFGSLKLQKQQTNSFIRKFRARIAGTLAISLWSALILAGVWHTHMIGTISIKMLDQTSGQTEPDFEAYDKASAMVGDTATTLYAVISPLATAVTGFYFVVKTAQDDEDDEDNGKK